MKKGDILMKKIKMGKKWKKIIFVAFFQKKMGKWRKKGKTIKKGDLLMKKVKIDKKWKNKFFWIFSEKYGKMSKKVKNDEKGWYIDKKGQNG